MNTTAALAHSTTWKGSKQSYLTARLLVDRGMVDDCLRGYAYFRWADDMIDIFMKTSAERTAFIARQKMLIETLYLGERCADLCPEEEMLADLIAHDRGPDGGLRSFIENFMAVIEFDANRNGRLVTRQEMGTYTAWLALAVMDGIQAIRILKPRIARWQSPEPTWCICCVTRWKICRLDLLTSRLRTFRNLASEWTILTARLSVSGCAVRWNAPGSAFRRENAILTAWMCCAVNWPGPGTVHGLNGTWMPSSRTGMFCKMLIPNARAWRSGWK